MKLRQVLVQDFLENQTSNHLLFQPNISLSFLTKTPVHLLTPSVLSTNRAHPTGSVDQVFAVLPHADKWLSS